MRKINTTSKKGVEKMFKKILVLALAVLMLLSLAACKKGGNEPNNDILYSGFYFEGNSSYEEPVPLGNPSTTLDPESVYAQLNYTPQMFYGRYHLPGGDEAEEKFGAEMSYRKDIFAGEEHDLTVLPFAYRAGRDNLSHSVYFIPGYDWIELHFMRRYSEGATANLDMVLCAYTVEGNKLICRPLERFEIDKETKVIDYELSDVTWEYEFSFKGRDLTLSAEGSSTTMRTGLDAYGEKDYFAVECELSSGSKSMNGIESISFLHDSEEYNRITFEMKNGDRSHTSCALLEESGLFTYTLDLEESTESYQYVYFYNGRDGIVFTDGENSYYYNAGGLYSDMGDVYSFVDEEEAAAVQELPESRLEEIVETKNSLLEDLTKAFADAGITVNVNAKTGEMAMDASILFGGDSAELTDEGKEFLNKFVEVYTTIVFSEKYDGFISKTMVEGHTAPLSTSTYESGLPLSEQRANAVKAYCVSSDTGVDTEKLAAALDAIGYSNSKPIVDENGDVDLAASRRVSFRFMINLDMN